MIETLNVIFDLDGTLIDSAPAIHAVANAVMAGHGYPPLDQATVRGFVGHGVPNLVRRLVAAHGGAPDGPLAKAVLAEFLSRYETDVAGNTVYPGVPEALTALAARGCRLGICTNKPRGAALAALAHVGLGDRFAVIVGGDTLASRKPDPEMLRHSIAALGAGPVLYVGDSAVDALTAANAGVSFALYTEGYRSEPVASLPHDLAFDDWRLFPALVETAL